MEHQQLEIFDICTELDKLALSGGWTEEDLQLQSNPVLIMVYLLMWD